MTDIDGIAKTIHIHGDTTHISVGNREDLFPLDITGLNVQTSMKMPRARFSEITRQNNVIIYWRAIIDV